MRLPEIKLEACPESDEARAIMGFKWADAEVGTRHKIGGAPDFQQDPHVPVCPTCGESMTFYGQLDSVGDRLILADCGLVYVFVCFDCYQTASFIQSA